MPEVISSDVKVYEPWDILKLVESTDEVELYNNRMDDYYSDWFNETNF